MRKYEARRAELEKGHNPPRSFQTIRARIVADLPVTDDEYELWLLHWEDYAQWKESADRWFVVFVLLVIALLIWVY